ncbi:hypothetical protein R1sor_022141 [Riccia sorocarpa]|uniref:non-specific serine/threonine protein kinase n=1 Tax=Riccia sorocarpa TaxID=122646 RepID=A0ABD3GJ00_9MARC
MFNISRAATSSRPAMVNVFELYAAITADVKTFDGENFTSCKFLDKLVADMKVRLMSSHESVDTFGDPCKPSPWSWLKSESFQEVTSFITEIDLSNRGLDGVFTAELQLPEFLTVFNLSNNHFSGLLPIALGNQTLVVTVDLSDNDLSGAFPAFPNASLEFLNLASNHMSGTISAMLYSKNFELQPLRVLILSENSFSGMVPDVIWGSTSQLQRVILERYLCRYSEFEDYYWKYLEGTRNEHLIIGLSVSGSLVPLIACILLILLARVWKRVKLLHRIQEELAKEDEAVLITGIKHRNLVQLKGCCVRDKKRMLVYEYAQNGNLAQALWGKARSSPLTWAQRLKICVGVAKGLSYLHEELQPKVIHRDIKPQNILLDKDWNAKIADFGLARPMKGDEGTEDDADAGEFAQIGYLAPEYAVQGLITEKLDVCSYGILLLQIISGSKCFDSSATSDELDLRTWAFKLYRVGCLLSLAEQNLLAVTSAEEILLKIALCLQVVHNKRPSMKL